MSKRKNDFFLVIALIVVAAVIWTYLYVTRTQGAYVSVTIDGELYGEYSLATNAEIRIDVENGYNILVIDQGEASITEASCPDKLCVHQGKIRFDGQSIICLPNKVVVEVVGGEESEFDAVVK